MFRFPTGSRLLRPSGSIPTLLSSQWLLWELLIECRRACLTEEIRLPFCKYCMISPESAWNAREEDLALLVLPDVREGGVFGLQINLLLLACQASAWFILNREGTGWRRTSQSVNNPAVQGVRHTCCFHSAALLPCFCLNSYCSIRNWSWRHKGGNSVVSGHSDVKFLYPSNF